MSQIIFQKKILINSELTKLPNLLKIKLIIILSGGS